MGVFYTAGEQKIRPGVYQRYSNVGGSIIAGALNGVCAIIFTASWGPIGTVTTHETSKSLEETYGAGAGVEVAKKLFAGGASKVYAVRAAGTSGSPGTAGTKTLTSNAVTVTAKYFGAKSIKVKIATDVSDSSVKNIYILDGTTQLEKFSYATSSDEKNAFIAAVANSRYITATGGTSGAITAQEVTLTGTDPVPSIDEYEDALYLLEPYDYNVICTDKAESNYNGVLAAYIDEVYQSGKLIQGVVGGVPGTPSKDEMFTAKANYAATFNDEKIIYMGSTWIDSNNEEVSTAAAVAYTAGMVAGTPSTQSIVHTVVKGAADLTVKLTNAQHETAITKGMLTLSLNPDGQVWFDSGVNTLLSLDATQDEGWKKIRRVKTRFEVLYRVDKTVAPKVGKVNCDADGIADIIQAGMGVLYSMCAEKKIKSTYEMYIDPELGYGGDSAWFIIAVDDIDSLEKIYLHYHFRYSDAV